MFLNVYCVCDARDAIRRPFPIANEAGLELNLVPLNPFRDPALASNFQPFRGRPDTTATALPAAASARLGRPRTRKLGLQGKITRTGNCRFLASAPKGTARQLRGDTDAPHLMAGDAGGCRYRSRTEPERSPK